MDTLLNEAGLATTHAEAEAKIDEVATIQNARAWQEQSEQFIFCIDLLGMSAHDRKSDWAVNLLEDRFEALLAE